MPIDDPNSSNARHDAGSDPVNEKEVDRVLAEAVGLSGQLEDEVGVEQAVSRARSGVGSGTGQSEAADVDDQLNKVEQLLRGMGTEPEPRPDDQSPPKASGREEPPPSKDEPSAVPEPEPGPSATQLVPVAEPLEDESRVDSPPPDESARPDDAAEPNEESAAPEAPNEPDPPEVHAEAPAPEQSMQSRGPRQFDLRRLLTLTSDAFCEGLLAVSDFFDNRFAWIGYGARRVIGWIALALLVAAGSIAAYSLS
jgi:hypothetical protein